MSSIFGVYRWSARLDLVACFRALSQAMRPYGPAKSSSWHDEQIVLASNLQGFLPEDHFDVQPAITPDGHSWLVAELRLDNRSELIQTLGLAQPQTLADSHILAHAWQRWGPACLNHLVGSFAFAVWCPATGVLFAARDHTGERPLFFHRGKDFFAFASMPAGLLALPGVNQGVNEETLIAALTLARYSQSVSFFKGIERLPPGHFLRVTPENVEVTSYWRPFAAPPVHFQRDSDYVEAFLEIFDAAVEARLRSTGRIGSQLSSGLDSSSVTTSAARLLARRGESLTSFTAVPRPDFSGKGSHGRLPDEGPGARDVAALYPNIEHVLLDSAGEDLVQNATHLSDAIGEPVQNSINGLWIAATLRAAAAHGINTLLVGVRGNLTISHSGIEALGLLLRQGRWLKLARTMHSFRRQGFVSLQQSAAFATAGMLPHGLSRRLHRAHTFDLTYSAVNPQLAADQRLHDKMLEEFFGNQHDLQKDRLHLFQVYDFDTYTAGYGAVHGIDVRDPCADRRVLDFCFSVPSEQYIAGGMPRSLIRRAMADRLPASTLTRTLRGQQGADWFLTVRDALPALRQQIALNEHSPTAARLLDLPRMRTLLDTWPATLENQGDSAALGDALCRGFSFGYFMRRHELAEPHS